MHVCGQLLMYAYMHIPIILHTWQNRKKKQDNHVTVLKRIHSLQLSIKKGFEPGVVAHIWNHSPQEAEVGELKTAGRHNERLTQGKKEKEKLL